MNTTVTATGMAVKAVSDATLLISTASDGTFADSATQSSASASMKPATSFDGQTFAIIDNTKAKVAAASASTATMNDGSALTAAGLKTESTNTGSAYWLDTTYYLKYSDSGNSTVPVYVKQITVAQNEADTTMDMYKQ